MQALDDDAAAAMAALADEAESDFDAAQPERDKGLLSAETEADE